MKRQYQLFDGLQKTIHSAFAQECQLCHLSIGPEEQGYAWCQSCLQYFIPSPRCQRCGLPTLTETLQCGECLSSPPLWHSLYCVGDYKFPLITYIHKLKYKREFWQAKSLASLLAPQISSPAALITSVPLHWQRQLFRGFNQSAVLAFQLSNLLHVPYDNQIVKRVRSTPHQQGLSKLQRKRNLKNAFALKKPITHEHIAIVDDVVTTGSTMHQLCLLMLDAGVKKIDIYCICRTP